MKKITLSKLALNVSNLLSVEEKKQLKGGSGGYCCCYMDEYGQCISEVYNCSSNVSCY